MLSVLISADRPLCRASLRAALASASDIAVLSDVATVPDALAVLDNRAADIIVLGADVSMDHGAALRDLRRNGGCAGMIMLGDATDDHLFTAVKAGAAAYAPPDIAAPDLCTLIRAVARGENPINDLVARTPAVADRMLAEFRIYLAYGYTEDDAKMFAPLTAHEIAILDCIARGMTNSEIAAALVITDVTVKTHVRSILAKLQVNDRTMAVVAAIQHGWVTLGGVGGPARQRMDALVAREHGAS